MRRVITILIIGLLSTVVAQGQIKIGGNVYGGGNKGNVGGSTKVTVLSGDIGAVEANATRPLEDPKGKVFGGARMANVGGNTFVHIDGEHASGYIIANQVFGGNDIAGRIGTAAAVSETMPTELTAVKREEEDATDIKKNDVDNTFNSYVRVSTKATTEHYTAEEIAAAASDPENAAYGKSTTDVKPDPNAKKVYIGQLFAGGNGNYDYEQTPGSTEGKVTHTIYSKSDKDHKTPIVQIETAEGEVGFQMPELDKTYLEVVGGSIVYAYGGGNNVTVKEKAIIHIDNPSAVVNHVYVDDDGLEDLTATEASHEGKTDLLCDERFLEMGINTTFSAPSSGAYQVGRFFGGNNLAEMNIRPTWNLLAGKVRNLYSGGNKGNMTSPEGLLLEIPEHSTLIVDNLYGGCRMADVMPTVNGEYAPCTNLPGYNFPNELSARTLVRGGYIHNVYGGNDVTGNVYGGNAVGIYTKVYGNVYGGGNGAYPYTDNDGMAEDPTFADFYYGDKIESGQQSYDALNAFRPNAEQVSIRLKGKGLGKDMTIVHGSIFVGGNCASLATKKKNPKVELRIGSYVIADNVYLGNNGEGMINKDYLKYYANPSFSSMNFADASVFASYMEGVAMTLQPSIVFDNTDNGDTEDYKPYTSYVGSFFCGGNVGSMAIPGKETFTVSQGLNIYNKFVGGSNNADVPELFDDETNTKLNAAYEGGVIGSKDERTSYTDASGNIKDRLEINLDNLTIVPLRWDPTNAYLIWNTNKWGYVAVENGVTLTKDNKYYTSNQGEGEFTATGSEVADGTNYFEQGFVEVPQDANDKAIRLLGGNVYGGCYQSGHVNGNVVININEDVVKRDEVFGNGVGIYGRNASGVDLEEQRYEINAAAMSVFAGGYGKDTEIWGSTTVNHNNGYMFQAFGGGELGVVGRKRDVKDNYGNVIDQEYYFDPAYSTTVNLNGSAPIYSDDGTAENLAEAEFLYGGGSEGDVCGNTLVNLGNGRIHEAFGGATNANILGHAEVYVGRQPNGSGGYKDGFPWIRNIVYGGSDFGGTIHGNYETGYNFEARLRDYATDKTQLHGYKAGNIPEVLKSSTYVEYLAGHVKSIFGGGYGSYDYTNTALYGSGTKMPDQHSAFVNIRPRAHDQNIINAVFGGGAGYPGNRDNDVAQDRSYVLIDIPDGNTKFSNMEVFGAGSYNGLGMGLDKDKLANGTVDLDEASAIIDLLHGNIHNAYGGSYNEGITRHTVVNVPAQSSIQIDNIFGGAYGTQILPPCDVYETQVNYKNTSEKAQVSGAIYGGNNNERRSLFTQVNISSPVWSNKTKGYTGTVYGAGRGIDTWSEYTEVNLLSGAKVYNVYGGGELGHVLNTASVQAYQHLYMDQPSPQIGSQDSYWKTHLNDLTTGTDESKAAALALWRENWKDAWKIGSYYNPSGAWNDYATNAATNLSHVSNRAELDDKTAALLDGKKYNTNVIVNEGAIVEGYAYGGGLGDASVALSGDVYGTTYVAVLGGEVKKDVYAGGRAGGLDNLFGADSFSDPGNAFVASANAYIQGGTARNVYGGGYLGHVGHHEGDITADFTNDRPAKANVVIGKLGTNTFTGGAPAITRNVYGGGEGGSVYGDSKITLNNGYIGYRYENKKYVEELDDQKPNDIDLAGNVFGGGYVVNSYVDNTQINMYGGQVRGSLFGGGEVGPIGRGANKTGLNKGMENGDATIFRAGTTQVNMYDGKVLRNVFGGGRGKDSWGGDGTLYMDKTTVSTLTSNGLMCKGYVFGQTRVNIYGGEIGTNEGMAYGYGNVFGGGDEGVVYSAYMDGNNLRIGKKDGVRYNKGLASTDPSYNYQGYYYKYDGTNFITQNVGTELEPKNELSFTEDCKVLVEPHCQAYVDISIGGTPYKAGDYVPTSALNKLKDKKSDADYWANLDPDGIIIHNAVFAGGNIATGSSSLFANATTVYGNATASIHDAYNRDLITIGTGHTGGLYGDGNLTFVDGYRELNITNYGTDYYHIDKQLDYETYKKLPEREKAYYELKYKCLQECTDIVGTKYAEGSNLPMDELLAMFTKADGTSVKVGEVDVIITVDGKKVPNPDIWKENGVVSIYAGRIMNTIQRADLCGVFGSRMVMKGAQDRVPETADYTNYTINRVREVSLNKMDSNAGDTGDNAVHGNYFGIYSVVNYLGALTSDVKFTDIRKTKSDNADLAADETTSYYKWKSDNITNKKRNNGTCHNQVALASGVYLELTTELSTGNGLNEKDWGPITGIVELDLINVQPGIGGGFVYAKNQHGAPSTTNNVTTTLTALNQGAATQWDYSYDDADASRYQWQTSGNFIHSSQTIIDDCYNISNRYLKADGVPAHYWYIAGTVYVYDQYISAYTGVPNAYSKTVELPITISAASHGTMTLMDVQPNLYAYYATYVDANNNTRLSGEQKLVINDVTYQLNSPIGYWDWNKLPASEKKLFVADTYVLKDSCYINNKYYPAGYVMLPAEYNSLKTHAVEHEIDGETVLAVKKATKNGDADVVEKDWEGHDVYVAFDDAFRSSNNMSHDKGYLLTYNVTNPSQWNKWYTKKVDDTREKNQTGGDDYHDGPTYHPTTTGVYGQQEYSLNAIIPQKTYNDYQGLGNNKPDADDQAIFESAYLVTTECTSAGQHYYPGAPVAAAIDGHTAPAYVCTTTIQLSPTEYIYVNDLMTKAQKDKLKTDYPSLTSEIDAAVVPAYICTTAGLYGGSYYETGKNYRALEAYSAMSPADREKFTFNYDALDLLIDPEYGGTVSQKYQYDSEKATLEGAEANAPHYSLETPINYTATYNGETALTLTSEVSVKRNGTPTSTNSIQKNDELLSTVYEALPNERHYYAPIQVAAEGGTYYVVKEGFVHGERPYAVGSTIDKDTYDRLSGDEQTKYVTELTFEASEVVKDGSNNPLPFYYCREGYAINSSYYTGDLTGAVKSVKGVGSGTTYTSSTEGGVPAGIVIKAADYANLVNKQLGFIIHGESPMETSTLYVARHADINDLSSEKIITVVYKYDYEESDTEGTHITPVTERHVVNIHINFKSGVPTVDDINPPSVVLPGTGITMRIPSITPGAYEITGGGWELFEKPSDAESHTNGVEYTPNSDPLYWYQDGFYLAYYAKTYLGKTYSNHVPVSVANYHDLKEVMDDKVNHLHVDYDRTRLKRDSKIYINDYSSSSQNGLDLLKDFYDLSLLSSSSTGVTNGVVTAEGNLKGHSLLNTHETNGVKAGHNLQFILRTDINHTGSWTPIASTTGSDPCFNGTFHGDGHTISGLNNSLFGNLCGSVYNLGVTGSFTSAGVADTGDGYVESCWINTTGTPDGTAYAVFGNPSDEVTTTKQIVNSYYQETKGYKTAASDHGVAIPKSDRAFYNGEVAFDLNNFYLYKRYNDHTTPGGTPLTYNYFEEDGEGKLQMKTGKYADNASLCSSGYNGIKYVEERFADGDFRYAAGEIPTTDDERRWIDTEHDNKPYYFPIWPDDYLFFGQKLTYGWAAEAHQDVPTAVVKSGGRLSADDNANRVYRAPAYYRSKTMGVTHFNPNAYLAQKSNDGTKEAYPNMTAIDFAGHYGANEANGAYSLGKNQNGLFYTPLLDDDGLTGIQNCDETQNLLVYAPSAAANEKTLTVLSSYFSDPVYNSYYDNSKGYRLVAQATDAVVHGHLVQSTLKATNDHLLVDKQDFNAPIAYSFDADHLMWYQRVPGNDEYVDRTKGWQGISVPFTAELVTTDQKGEITHFYSGSEQSKNGTGKKIGHEYWLRELTGISIVPESAPEEAKASFLYPTATGSNKTVTNHFLWDYYYEKTERKDKNSDLYQEYYKSNRTYSSYPLLAKGTPYIIGLPGNTYYEFDLSGNFTAQNTYAPIEKLGKQTITFASDTGTEIGVSDDETAGVQETITGTNKSYSLTFKPSYMNMSLEAGTNNYTLDADGDSFDKVPNEGTTTVSAFRPYFTSGTNNNSRTRTIIFDNEQTDLKGEENHGDPTEKAAGTLKVYAKKDKIYVESSLNYTTDVRIVTAAGITVANFTVKPGQTMEVQADFSGMYIVHTEDGLYMKKVTVKK